MITLVLTAAAFIFSGPVAGCIVLALAVMLAVVLWSPLRGWLGIPGGPSGAADPLADPVARQARDELVAIIEHARKLVQGVSAEPGFASYDLWRQKSADFIEAVFGAVERQRFDDPYDPPGVGLARELDDRVRRLRNLRDRPETWDLRVAHCELHRAIDDRRWLSPADKILVAGDPAWLSWPDERRELAYDLDVAANDLESWLSGRADERPEIEARNVAAMMQANADENPSEVEVRRDASDYSDKVTLTNYALGAAKQVGALFDQAANAQVVSKREREAFVKPENHAALERLPDRLRELAERLREPKGGDQ